MPTSNRLFCRLDGLTPGMREQQRVSILKNLGLLEAETVPVFDEATQTAARFIEAPICILGLMVHEQLWLKSAIGLSRLGLMNQIASSRKIPLEEAFCTYVVDSQQSMIIEDTYNNDVFAKSLLSQHYGIRSYLGTPLITSNGWCIGTLAVMDLEPRQFTPQQIEFLALCARWCLREFERDYLCKLQLEQGNEWLIVQPHSKPEKSTESGRESSSTPLHSNSFSTIKLKLLTGLTQELRTPLTAVIGMASILCGEVFGPLTPKQREYVEIIRNSGQQINALVSEMLKMGATQELETQLQLSPVNVETHSDNQVIHAASLEATLEQIKDTNSEEKPQALLALLLSCHIAESHGGKIMVQGSAESGYRYVLMLPKIATQENSHS